MSDFTGFIFGTGTIGLIPAMFIMMGPKDRQAVIWWLERRLRPTKVRRQYRAGIRQAQSILRLIEGTNYFEHNLDQDIYAFLPQHDSGPYWTAFKRVYRPRADQLRRTQRLWARMAARARTAGQW